MEENNNKEYKLFEEVEFQVTTGQTVHCAKQGFVLVPISKISIYAMGRVAMYPQEELRQLQQLKQNEVPNHTPTSSSCDPKAEVQIIGSKHNADNPPNEKEAKTSSESMLSVIQDKPQIDLHEFLQQMGVLKDEKQSGSSTKSEALSNDFSDNFGECSDKSVNWEELMEMHAVADNQGSEATQFQAYDINEDLTFTTSIWDF